MYAIGLKWVTAFCKRYQDHIAIGFFIFVVAIFFHQTLLYGKIPVPSDTLVGLYHPWRDAYARTFANGVPFKNFLITDPVRQQIPWRRQVIDAFKEKKLPLWDATSFSGVPLLANIQSGALYPLNILFFLFSFPTAWAILIISQPLLAGLFLYLFLRHKQLDPISSVTGSLCFAFSGFSVSWLTWGTIGSTILWLPLMFLSFEKIHEVSNKTQWRLVLIFSVIASFFAGHLQIFLYSMVVFLLYAVWTYRKVRLKSMYAMHLIVPLIIMLITAPVWLRFISFFPTTSRIAGSVWQSEGFFIPLKQLVQFIAPDYFGNPATLNYWGTWNYGEMVGYVGVVGLLLALIGSATGTAFWSIVVFFCLLFAIDSPIARIPFLLSIPGIDSLQPTRLLGIIDIGLSILSAFGMSQLLKGEKKKQMVITLAVLSIFFIGMWGSILRPAFFGVPLDQVAVVKRNLILPSFVFVGSFAACILFFLLRKKWEQVRYVVGISVVVLLTFELLRFGWKFTPFTSLSYFFPETKIISELKTMQRPFRVMATDDRLVPPNVLSYYNIESVSGYDPIHSLRYEEYIAAMERGVPDITPPFGFGRIIAPKTITSPLFSLLNIQYVLSMDAIISPKLKLLSVEGTTKLYKVVGSVSRVYLADTIISEPTKKGVITRLYDATFVPGKTAVVESPISLLSVPLAIDETAELATYSSDRMVIRVLTKNPRLLVIGNMMDPYWRVTIDGKNAKIVRVNYLFFGVVVPDGSHTVAVQYK